MTSVNRRPLSCLVFALLAVAAWAQDAPGVLRFEAEDISTPAEAWVENRETPDHWNLWSTDRDAERKWSEGIVLRSPAVMEDRATPEEGAPPLHAVVTGLPPGSYAVEIGGVGRPLGVSFDGVTWRKQTTRNLGEFTITDGRFELWVDDRYAADDPDGRGPCYFDYLQFSPVLPSVNGVRNGDFEFTPGEGVPGWSWWTREEGAGTIRLTDEAHGGGRAVLIEHTGERDFAFSNSGRRRVEAGEKLTATAWVRTEGEGTVNLAVVGLREGQVVSWAIGQDTARAGADWRRLQAYVRVPRNVDEVYVRITGSGQVRAWVDDVALAEGWEAPIARAARPLVQGWATERVTERLGRGPVAVALPEGRVYLNWRLLADDPTDVGFHVYRRLGRGLPVRLTERPISRTCDFIDTSPAGGQPNYYFVRPVRGETEGEASAVVEIEPSAEGRPYLSIPLQGDYTFQKCGIADLDGDGEYDYVIKQPNVNVDPADSYWKPSEGTYTVEAYLADGTFLWKYDLGWGIEQGIWYSPMIVHDLDGDGRAEVAVKTGPEGDPRDPDGRVTTGAEYLSILDGMTGEERARVDWPSRDEFPSYNYASRNLMCVAYLDGRTPCLIVDRGTYNVMIVVAYQFHDGRLTELWRWRDSDAGGLYRGQGAHSMHAVDVDGDGRDEVFLGSAVLDDNGDALWSTGLGHPDHHYVGDIDPTRPGLEVYYGIEPRQPADGCSLFDARTGEWLWGLDEPTQHVHGTGMCADIDPRYPGMECYSGERDLPEQRWLWSAQGELIEKTDIGGLGPRVVYWDADLQREIVRGGRIEKFRGPTVFEGLQGSVIGFADVVGDWREELIVSVPGELRVYTTTIPAEDRRVCLMQDPLYRADVAIQAMGYTQCPMTGACFSAERANLGLVLPAAGVRPGETATAEVVVTAAANAPLQGTVMLAGEDVELGAERIEVDVAAGQVARYPLPLTLRRARAELLGGGAGIVRARFEGTGGPLSVELTVEPLDEPLTDFARVQAEEFTAQGGGEVQLRDDKIGADGRCFSHWDAVGHWLEWTLTAPADGRYLIAVRYCAQTAVRREVALDGKPLGEFSFPSTGGFSGERSNWRHAVLRGPDGSPLVVELTAGAHVLRMTNADGKGMNLDYVLLAPAG